MIKKKTLLVINLTLFSSKKVIYKIYIVLFFNLFTILENTLKYLAYQLEEKKRKKKKRLQNAIK